MIVDKDRRRVVCALLMFLLYDIEDGLSIEYAFYLGFRNRK